METYKTFETDKYLCNKCGNEVKENQKFCNKCGASMLLNRTHITAGMPKYRNDTEENICKVISKHIPYPEEDFKVDKTCYSYTTLFFKERAIVRVAYYEDFYIQILMVDDMKEKYANNSIFTSHPRFNPKESYFISYFKGNDLTPFLDIIKETCDKLELNEK